MRRKDEPIFGTILMIVPMVAALSIIETSAKGGMDWLEWVLLPAQLLTCWLVMRSIYFDRIKS